MLSSGLVLYCQSGLNNDYFVTVMRIFDWYIFPSNQILQFMLNNTTGDPNQRPMEQAAIQKGFQVVNGLNMYYEIHDARPDQNKGVPLVLIHGGGSTIDSSFGRILPKLAITRKVIALELQAHGRTGDRNKSLSFEQDAADVAELLCALDIAKADLFGYSNGGQTALQIALSYPDLVHKLILASIFYKRSAASDDFWDGFNGATLETMPLTLREAFLNVNPDSQALQNMFDKDVSRMKHFKEWSDDQVRMIRAKTLIVQGNVDVGSLDHALEMHRNIINSELVILPGAHGNYMGAIEFLAEGRWTMPYFADLLIEFLDRT